MCEASFALHDSFQNKPLMLCLCSSDTKSIDAMSPPERRSLLQIANEASLMLFVQSKS